MVIQGLPIYVAANIISEYIYAITRKRVRIQTPIQPEHEEKFIKALTQACGDMNIQL